MNGMELYGDFALRLLVAGLMGVAIGLEREYRAKEAGYRTHFLVALGSALMMIVSQYGFTEVLKADLVRLDPSRIAGGQRYRFHWCGHHHPAKADCAWTDDRGWYLGYVGNRTGHRGRDVYGWNSEYLVCACRSGSAECVFQEYGYA